MKKIWLVTLAIALALAVAVIACKNDDGTTPHTTHDSGKWVTTLAATCTANGTRELQCTVCGAVLETDTIDALGHDWGEWDATTDPTCEDEGEGTRECNRCGIEDLNTAIPALGHDYEWEITTPPTNDTNGEETGTCTHDPTHTDTRTIPKGIYTIEALTDYLSGLPNNTAETPYTVILNVDNFTSISGGTFSNKYVDLDLSGSTMSSIGSYAFFGNSYLVSVIIPNTVISIGSSAFRTCYNLTNVTIPESVTNIEVLVFADCYKLTAINISSGNTAFISEDGLLYNKEKSLLFSCPPGKTGTVTIPNSVTTIGTWAFFYCISITDVTIPNSVTNIMNGAFSGCSSLTSVTIPESVTSIEDAALDGCGNLTVINVNLNNTAYTSAEGILYNKNQTILIQCPSGKTGTITVPNSVTTIGSYAFRYCENITDITIQNGVTSIGSQAFLGCSSLTSFIIPNSVTNIPLMAFANCNNLTSVTFEGTINSYNFSTNPGTFSGDLRDKFYATDSANGTPGTYTTTNPGSEAVWTKQ